MDYNINLLHIGNADTKDKYPIPPEVTWYHVSPLECAEIPGRIREKELPEFEVILLEEEIREILDIESAINPYSIVFCKNKETDLGEEFVSFIDRKMGVVIDEDIASDFWRQLPQKFFGGQYGAKLHIHEVDISRRFVNDITFNGSKSVSLSGNFGKEWSQLLTWRYDILLEKGAPLELWLEYTKDESMDIRLVVKSIVSGSRDDVNFVWTFEDELKDLDGVMLLESNEGNALLAVSLQVKGKGRIDVGDLHFRYSHLGYGVLKTGGIKKQDASRGEVISFFDPMDRKPPLCVYFSGYRPAEGFEGYYMMRMLGAPFLLIADLRLEGGAFYMGSKEYEDQIKDIIQNTLDKLGFTRQQLILSGLSMGSTGALYYSPDFLPYQVIVGKPLTNMGNIAYNEKYHRPGGFPTSLDVLMGLAGGIGPEQIKRANDIFWDKFDRADFSNTRFAISYMKDDDYDLTAYEDLVKHLSGKEVTIYGKGMTGRHNDNTNGVIEWFVSRFDRAFMDAFNRKRDENR